MEITSTTPASSFDMMFENTMLKALVPEYTPAPAILVALAHTLDMLITEPLDVFLDPSLDLGQNVSCGQNLGEDVHIDRGCEFGNVQSVSESIGSSASIVDKDAHLIKH